MVKTLVTRLSSSNLRRIMVKGLVMDAPNLSSVHNAGGQDMLNPIASNRIEELKETEVEM
jgi:hypothetical protein